MRQVPQNFYLVVGDGKMARHWIHFLKINNLNASQWSRSQSSETDLEQRLQECSAVFVAISDDALENFFKRHLTHFSGTAFHFSGSYYRSGFVGLHPLMTFSEDLYSEAVYRAMGFTVDHTVDPLAPPAKAGGSKNLDFLDLLENSISFISSSDKKLYHALCVVAANFPQMLWKFSLSELTQLGIDSKAVAPLITKAMENFLKTPESALTGPHSRGDNSTINANLLALKNYPEREIYEAFTRVYGTPHREESHVRA